MDKQKRILDSAYNFDSDEKEKFEANKLAKLRDSFTYKESVRYEVIQTKIELELGKSFGHKLPKICTDRLIDRVLLSPTIYAHVVSGDNIHLPQTASEWSHFTKDLADNDIFANAALINADRAWKAQVKEDALAAIPPAQKISMQRSGNLDSFLSEKLQSAINERTGL